MNEEDPIEQVSKNKARYCRYVDTKRWDDFASLIAPNPEIFVYDEAGRLMHTFDSRDVYVDACRNYLDGAKSIHQVHNAEISHASAEEILAIWSMEDYVIFPPGRAEVDPRPAIHHGFGHYHETWKHHDGEWMLSRMELRRTILQIVPKSK